jgi:hypothetical protein
MERWAKKLKEDEFVLAYIRYNGLQNHINWVQQDVKQILLKCKETKRVERFIVKWLSVREFNVKEVTKLHKSRETYLLLHGVQLLFQQAARSEYSL